MSAQDTALKTGHPFCSNFHVHSCGFVVLLQIMLCFVIFLLGLLPALLNAQAFPDAELFRRIPIPNSFLVTENGHTFGGDLRIGDLNGDGQCDFLVYRSGHSGPGGPAIG